MRLLQRWSRAGGVLPISSPKRHLRCSYRLPARLRSSVGRGEIHVSTGLRDWSAAKIAALKIEQLRRIQHHQIRIAGNAQAVTGISKLTSTQDEVFHALKLKKPTAPQQLALL